MTYRAPWWLPGGHLQTLYAYFFVRKPRIVYRRERWELPDGDFLDLDWIDGPGDSPLVVLFHGLEGNARGHYARALMRGVQQRVWRGVVVNFRGCSGVPNRLPRAYHSGDSEEIQRVLHRLRPLAGDAPFYAVGVSLGGNALLKWLGESGDGAKPWLNGAVAISPPADLTVAGTGLDKGFNRWVYTGHFLRSLRKKAIAKVTAHHLPISRQELRSTRTLYGFDNIYTAPLHGYRDADDYWRRASSLPWLNSISVPTLLIHAMNDPFLSGEIFAGATLGPGLRLETPWTGGHVGFVSGPFPGNLNWLPQRTLDFLSQVYAGQRIPSRHNISSIFQGQP